jgi:hypothetical protein
VRTERSALTSSLTLWKTADFQSIPATTGTGFGPLLLSQNVFSDAQGWNLLSYYTSLRFADVNGDGRPEICGRGQAGGLQRP